MRRVVTATSVALAQRRSRVAPPDQPEQPEDFAPLAGLKGKRQLVRLARVTTAFDASKCPEASAPSPSPVTPEATPISAPQPAESDDAAPLAAAGPSSAAAGTPRGVQCSRKDGQRVRPSIAVRRAAAGFARPTDEAPGTTAAQDGKSATYVSDSSRRPKSQFNPFATKLVGIKEKTPMWRIPTDTVQMEKWLEDNLTFVVLLASTPFLLALLVGTFGIESEEEKALPAPAPEGGYLWPERVHGAKPEGPRPMPGSEERRLWDEEQGPRRKVRAVRPTV